MLSVAATCKCAYVRAACMFMVDLLWLITALTKRHCTPSGVVERICLSPWAEKWLDDLDGLALNAAVGGKRWRCP